jgi:hypothetical protein
MTTQASTLLKFANLQMAAESLFEVLPSDAPGQIKSASSMNQASLILGNTRSSKFTTAQAAEFAADWKVVEHKSNTATGFSGTLFECLRTDVARGLYQGELCLSLRSTEFLDDVDLRRILTHLD